MTTLEASATNSSVAAVNAATNSLNENPVLRIDLDPCQSDAAEVCSAAVEVRRSIRVSPLPLAISTRKPSPAQWSVTEPDCSGEFSTRGIPSKSNVSSVWLSKFAVS